MILESYEWKRAIKRNNAYVRRYGKPALADEEGYLLDRIQIRIVTNALFVRRLLETPNVATALREEDVPVTAYPWKGSNVDYMNCHRLDEKYQINNPACKRVRGGVLCDQIIHSFVWTWISDEYEEILKGFIVSSDRKKHSEVYFVDMNDWLGYTQSIANSNPARIDSARNSETQQWEFTSE